MVKKKKYWILLSIGIIAVLITLAALGAAVFVLRDAVGFRRVLRRIALLDSQAVYGENYQETLREASGYARYAAEWRVLLQYAWNIPYEERWDLVYYLAGNSAERFPQDARYRIIAGLAAIHLQNFQRAREQLYEIEKHSITTQMLILLAIIGDNSEESAVQMLTALSEQNPEANLLSAAARALKNKEYSQEIWELTEVSAFGINAALHAAKNGEVNTVTAITKTLQTKDIHPQRVTLYLAAWLKDEDWLFRQLRDFSASEVFSAESRLLQADAYLRQNQLEEARLMYKEMQYEIPSASIIPYLNDAGITARKSDGDFEKILREGLDVHPDSLLLRTRLAGFLFAENRREEVLSILDHDSVHRSESKQLAHQAWLLRHAAVEKPLSRFESDLWTYLNANPDAGIVGQYLSRFLLLRQDTTGLAELRRRYRSADFQWAAVLHLQKYLENTEYSQAESMLFQRGVPADNWTYIYNKALFALQFLPISEASAVIAELRDWIYTYRVTDSSAQTNLLLLEAELFRLQGDILQAEERIEQAIQIDPANERLYTYRALLDSEH